MKKESVKLKIIKESVKVLIFASILSSIGGLGLESIKDKIFVILPIIILLPALNDMIGDLGIIITSKFTTALYLKKFKRPFLKSHFVRHIINQILPIGTMASIYIALLALFISMFKGFQLNLMIFLKVISISLITTLTLISFIIIIAILGGFYVYHKKQDPDDVLIPITTAIADLGAMLMLAFLVSVLF